MVELPQCLLCARFDNGFRKYNKCAAYPDGIPAEVWDNRVTHNKSYKGDGGLLFVENETLKKKS